VQKSKSYGPITLVPGTESSVTVVDKSVHKHKRRFMSKALSEKSVRDFEPTMITVIDTYIKSIAEPLLHNKSASEWSEPFEMTSLCRYIGYDATSSFAFGESLEMLTKTDNRFLVDAIGKVNIRSGIYMQYPSIAKYKLEQRLFPKGAAVMAKFREVVTNMVIKRLEAGVNAKNDLLSSISGWEDPKTGKGLSREDIWLEGRTLLLAGSDTYTTTLAAFFFYISRNPTVYSKLVREIRNTFSTASEIQRGPKLSSCQYLRACIDETLRISPPAGEPLWREVLEGGVTINGNFVPAGVDIGSSIYSIHHNELYFANSHHFDPERWLSSKESLEEARSACFPFSIGSRDCVGKAMAYMEMSLVLARTFWFLDVKRAEGELGLVGGGNRKDSACGRGVEGEFQIQMHFLAAHEGPHVQFRLREGVRDELFAVSG